MRFSACDKAKIQENMRNFNHKEVKFYHGTSSKKFDCILERGGLIPRSILNTDSNFKAGSNTNGVYLTTSFDAAEFYAYNSAYCDDSNKIVIEIPGNKLDEFKFRPDENIFASMFDVSYREAKELVHKPEYACLWKHSLFYSSASPLVSYNGDISVDLVENYHIFG